MLGAIQFVPFAIIPLDAESSFPRIVYNGKHIAMNA